MRFWALLPLYAASEISKPTCECILGCTIAGQSIAGACHDGGGHSIEYGDDMMHDTEAEVGTAEALLCDLRKCYAYCGHAHEDAEATAFCAMENDGASCDVDCDGARGLAVAAALLAVALG